MTLLSLEDSYTDILNKAARGLGIDSQTLADRSHLSKEQAEDVLGGKFDAEVAAELCAQLGIEASRLEAIAEGRYHPATEAPRDGFAMFTTPYEDMTVNSYLVWDPQSREAVAFDSGADASELLDTIRKNELSLRLLLLTHCHGDHILDVDRLVERTSAEVWCPRAEPYPGAELFDAPHAFHVGALKISSRATHGHSAGGTTYVVDGLELPLAVVGDAMFAGSMGGAAAAWQTALKNNREQILSLPGDTILCPGHGPLTTVAQERANNPFFPEA